MAYQWQFAGYSGAGHYPTIHPDVSQAGVVWATSDVCGLFKSVDNGENWVFKTKGNQRVNLGCFKQAEGNRLIMFVGANGEGGAAYASGIERSIDGGENWTHLTGSSQLYQMPRSVNSGILIAMNRQHTNAATMHVYFGSANGNVYKSVDGGTTITPYATPFAGTRVSAMWMNYAGTYLFVGSPNNGIVRYDLNTNASFPISFFGTNGNRCRDFAEFILNGQRYICAPAGLQIAYSNNDGATWAFTSAVSANPAYAIGRLAAIASVGATTINDIRFFCTLHEVSNSNCVSFHKSTNGGVSWTNSAPGNSGVTYDLVNNPTRIWHTEILRTTTGVNIDPRNPDRIYVANDWGLFRSDNFGTSWVEKVKGAGNAVGTDVVIAPDGSIIMTAMDNGVFRSTDGGTTWKMCIPNNSGGQAYPQVAGHCWRIACLGSQADWNAGIGTCLVTNWPWDGANKNQILRSTNMGGAQTNGGTWSILTEATTGIPNANMQWDPTFIGSGSGHIRGLCKDSSNRIAVTLDGWDGGTSFGGVFLSGTNGQMPFVRKTPNAAGNQAMWRCYHGIAVSPLDSNDAVIVTWNGGGVRYTTNFLTTPPTWNIPASGNQFFIFDVVCSGNGVFYMSGSSGGTGIWRSVDGGANWVRIFTGGTNQVQGDGMCFHPGDPLKLYFSSTADYGIGPQKVYMTTNAEAGSVTWTDITGDLVDGTGFTRLAVRLNGNGDINSTQGYLYGSRYTGTLQKLNLDPGAAPGTGTLTSCSVVPGSLEQNASSTVAVAFTTANAWPDNGYVEVTFPTSLGAGFSFNQGGTTTAAFTSGGTGTLAVSITSNVVRLTRSGGSQINAATAVTLNLTFVRNPNAVGSTGFFQLHTKTSTGTLIDSKTDVAAVTIVPPPATYQPLTFEQLILERIQVGS